ncbi:MAG: hypothetical protein Q8920_06010 [Bacillota bacterium]|nr:hypothetical protein [Bacillota bacterium]
MIKKLSLVDKVKMFSFLKLNINNPAALIQAYKKEPEKWEMLKEKHPEYKEYLEKYPELAKQLKQAGINL